MARLRRETKLDRDAGAGSEPVRDIIIGTVLLILSAVIDLMISRWLFTRDNRMTLTEMKRESKENFGDPHVRSARKAERDRIAKSAGLTGINAASVFIEGDGMLVGITYKPDVSGVPIVAAKVQPSDAPAVIAAVKERGVKIMVDPATVAILMKSGAVGQPIPRETFTPVAQALVQAGFTG